MLGLGSSLAKGGASLLTFVKDNLKLYLDFKSNKSDTLKFPSEGSTKFDGNNDRIDLGTPSSLLIPSGTYAVWAYLNDDDYNTLYGRYNSGSPNAYDIRWQTAPGNKITLAINGGFRDNVSTFTPNQWNHFAITVDSNATITYVNGIATNTASGVTIGTSTVEPNYIGFHGLSTTHYFNGKMANFGIWSRVLEPEEVQSIMNKSYSQLKGVEKTSLVSWWALDSSTVSTNNLIPDSGFDDASAWNAEGDWSVNGTTSSKAVGAGAWEILRTNSGILTAGKKYRFTADVRRISGSSSGNFYFYANNTNSSAITPTTEVVTYTADLVSSGSGNYPKIRITGTAFTMEVDNFTVHEIDIHKDSHGSNDGSNFGATINSNVYGGNAPILPRAVDVAKEGQADAIGNGSASFNGSSDYVEVADSQVLQTNDDMTISAWINPTGTTSFRAFVMKRDAGGDNYSFYLSNDNPPKLRFFDGSTATSSTGTITKDEWQHVALSINSGVTDGSVFYINGIASGTATFTITADDAPLHIGKHQTDNTYFNGLISQVGIWQGALTQAQVQSVMESTSYSKIPADVKSTLGSELVQDSDWTEGTGWEDTGDNTWTYTSGTTSNLSAMNLSGLTVGNLYKIQYTITSNPDNVGLKWSGLNFFNANQGINSTVGTHTYYGVATTNDVEFRYQNGTGTIGLSNPSLKEVTNDIVAYYPLDGDSSRGNGTDDVTTGEVLGDELIENGIISTSQFALSPAYDSGTGVGATIDNGIVRIRTTGNAGVNINDDDLLESGALYKIVAVVSDATAGQLYFRGGNVYVTGQASTVGTHTIYLRTDGARLMISRNASDVDISISSLSVKKVLSNTGVLL